MEDYTIVITEEHLAGDKWIEGDCPGYRAFKDALPSEVYLNILPSYRLWAKNNNKCPGHNGYRWGSWKKYSDGELVRYNMMQVQVGDEIVFKHIC